MPFQKGRAKTGGKVKGSVNTARKSSRFLERLKGYGFNFDSEMAAVLKEIKNLRNADRSSSDAIKKIEELRYYYMELKSLLPYMTPKLKDKEVEATEPPELPSTEQISNEDLLKALGNEPEPSKNQPGTSDSHSVESGNPELQVPASSDEDLQNLAGESEEDE